MSRRRRSVVLFLVAAACNQQLVKTPVRSFDRPTDVALGCVQFDPKSQLYGPRPVDECRPERSNLLQITGDDGLQYPPRVRALVANSARGELAVADLNTAQIIDLDRRVPGYGFLPTGKLTEHVRTSADGCLALTSNRDSCDFARVRLDTLYNMPFETVKDGGSDFGADVVRRVVATAGGVPLGARPAWIEAATESQAAVGPFDPGGQPGMCMGGSYRFWAALPGCGVVVELQLSDDNVLPDGRTGAEVVRALRFSSTGVEIVADPKTLRCDDECSGSVASDPTRAGQPVSLSLVSEGAAGRLFVADRTSEKLTVAAFDVATGAIGDVHQIALEAGAKGVTLVKSSQRTPAGRFAYAIARDNTIRVVDLDREAECDTNVDGRFFATLANGDPLIGARRLGCFPVGDPATPPRLALAVGPGIHLPGDSLPTDISFVHADVTPPVDTSNQPFLAAPTFVVGDFAWVTSTDGRMALIQIYDGCPAPNIPQALASGYRPSCDPGNVDASRLDVFSYFGHPVPLESDRLSHRVRPGANRFFQATSVVDSAGQPRLSDEVNRFSITVNGVAAAEQVTDGTVTRTLPRLVPALVQKPPYITTTDAIDESIRFPDPHAARAETWAIAWEGILPLTARNLGRPLPGGGLRDTGAAFCQRGVRAGDKLDFLGCTRDADCNRDQSCVRDPAAPVTVTTGLCLDATNQLDEVTKQCGPLLRAVRRYRILSAKQEVPQATGERSDDLTLDEIYEPEFAPETHTCAAATDCADVTIPATDVLGAPVKLATTCVADWDGAKRCLRTCAVDGKDPENRCGDGFICAASRRGDERCMRSPLNDSLTALCMRELQRYQIRAGDAFLVSGSTTGAPNQLRVDPTTHECYEPPVVDETTRTVRPRIPLDAPACPTLADPLAPLPQGSTLNVCRYPSDSERVLHYESPQFTIALGQPLTPAVPKDDTVLSFNVVGGAFPFTVALVRGLNGDQALLPRAVVTAPDRETLFIVDEGKSSVATGLRGQLLLFHTQGQQVDPLFIVR